MADNGITIVGADWWVKMRLLILIVFGTLALTAGASDELNPDTIALVKKHAAVLSKRDRAELLRISEELEVHRLAAELCGMHNQDFLDTLRLIIKYIDTTTDLEYLDTLTPDEIQTKNKLIDVVKSKSVGRRLEEIRHPPRRESWIEVYWRE